MKLRAIYSKGDSVSVSVETVLEYISEFYRANWTASRGFSSIMTSISILKVYERFGVKLLRLQDHRTLSSRALPVLRRFRDLWLEGALAGPQSYLAQRFLEDGPSISWYDHSIRPSKPNRRISAVEFSRWETGYTI